jgi:hypothetical protein
MALRGRPREPFYMVGRMEGQSVVLRAEKGKLRLMVDDEEGGETKELVYEVNPKEEKEERDGKGGEDGTPSRREEKAEGVRAHGGGEVPGGVDVVDGAAEAGGDLSGDGGGLGSVAAVAGSGDGGDASGLAVEDNGGAGGGLEPPTCLIIGEEEPDSWRSSPTSRERLGCPMPLSAAPSGFRYRPWAGGGSGEGRITLFSIVPAPGRWSRLILPFWRRRSNYWIRGKKEAEG